MPVVNCLSDVKWDEEDCYLHDFTQKFKLPQVAKVTKGQYLGLGVPSAASPSISPMVLLAEVAKRLKIAAQCVKFKDGNRVIPVGTKLAIPANYEGWFEILSEQGRAVRCIDSVAELLKIFPETCLVRESIKAHLAKTDNIEIMSDKTRIIYSGETLVLVSEIHVSPVKSKSSGCYLRCFTSKGETVFLSADQKGKFSPIAGEDSISGVHSVKNLLSKRFPLMVRLVHGKPPIGLKNGSHFVTEMRLYSLFEEESIMALPLLKDSSLIALPLSAPLKIQAPKDPESVMKLKHLDLLLEKCNNLVEDASHKIQIFDISLSKELRTENFLLKKKPKGLPQKNRMKCSVLDIETKCKISMNTDKSPKENISPNKSDDTDPTYDDIDQIYNYIRGTVSASDKIIGNNNEHSLKSSSINCQLPTTAIFSNSNPPEPPPIETIPIRQATKDEPQCKVNSMEDKSLQSCKTKPSTKDFDKVISNVCEKERIEVKKDLFKKNCGNLRTNHARLFISHPINHGVKKFLMQSPAQLRIYHKSKIFNHSPSLKELSTQRQRTSRTKRFITSSIFNLRYKSLINLAIDSDCSNISERKFSGDNHFNPLRRPKSLTDLLGNIEDLSTDRNLSKTNGIENRKFIFFLTQESGKGKFSKKQQTKHIGTLYL